MARRIFAIVAVGAVALSACGDRRDVSAKASPAVAREPSKPDRNVLVMCDVLQIQVRAADCERAAVRETWLGRSYPGDRLEDPHGGHAAHAILQAGQANLLAAYVSGPPRRSSRNASPRA